MIQPSPRGRSLPPLARQKTKPKSSGTRTGDSCQARSPGAGEDSDSAESLTEIPVSATISGTLHSNNLQNGAAKYMDSSVVHGGYTGNNTLPRDTKSARTKRKMQREGNNNLDIQQQPNSSSSSGRGTDRYNSPHGVNRGDAYGNGTFPSSGLSSLATTGATDISMGTHTLPSTQILDPSALRRSNSRHRDVPPLDLGELSGQSDNEAVGSTSNKKIKKKVVTQI